MTTDDWLAARFEEQRPQLRAVVPPNARLPQRSRRRGAGSVVAPEPRRLGRHRQPRRLVDHGREPRVPRHAARAYFTSHHSRRGTDRRRRRHHRWRRRSRARGTARRCARPCAAGRARHARPGRATRVRPSRRVRGAVRRDRHDPRALAERRQTACQPRPPSDPGFDTRPKPPTCRVSAWSSTPSSRRRAAATSTSSSRYSTPTSCCGPTPSACKWAHPKQ